MSEKLAQADHLRAIATIAVIILHVAAPILNQYGKIPDESWHIGNAADSFVRFCVPVFLMLTGALVLPKIQPLGVYFKKRVSRIVYPFVFWSLIYIGYEVFANGLPAENASAAQIATFAFDELKNGAAYHLWYIYMVIGIYLIIPIFSKWIVASTKTEIRYYLVIWLVVIFLGMPYIDVLNSKIDLVYFTRYLGYVVLGYYLTLLPRQPKMKYFGLALFVIGSLATAAGTFVFTRRSGEFEELFYNYLTPNIVLQATGIFLFFWNIEIRSKIFGKISGTISNYSFGIYLSHVLVLFGLARVGIDWQFVHPAIGITVTAIACLILSLLITMAIRKLPLGKTVSG